MRALCDAWKTDRQTAVQVLNDMGSNESVDVDSHFDLAAFTAIPVFNAMEANELVDVES